MKRARRIAVIASISLFVLITSSSIPAQQQTTPPPAGKNNCGTVNCAAECDCQLTICDKSVDPNCVDTGVCVDCEGPSIMTAPNITIVALAVALIAGAGIMIYRRRRRSVSP